MRILVTGGAGFLGSHLVEKWLGDGHRITILNTYSKVAAANVTEMQRRGATIVWGSVTDHKTVEKTVCTQDVVVHLAARINAADSLTHPIDFVNVNVHGTVNVLEAVRAAGNHLIYASSGDVYGANDNSPVDERADLRPTNPHAASKAAADRMCFSYYISFGIDVVTLRPSSIYGKRQSGALIPMFIERAVAGEPLTIFGTGAQRREYIHVSDVVSAFDLVLQRNDLAGRVFNVGSGENVSVHSIAKFISEHMKVPVVHRPSRPGEASHPLLDCSAIAELGFRPCTAFWNSLERSLQRYKVPRNFPAMRSCAEGKREDSHG